MAPTWAVPGLFKIQCSMSNEKWKKLISPLPRGGRRIGSSAFAFLSRQPFGYYLPIISNGELEAVVSKRLVQGQKGLTVSTFLIEYFTSDLHSIQRNTE